MSSEPRKMNEKKAPNTKNAERLAATRVRCFTTAIGTSGASERASTRTNATSSSAAPANSSSVVADVQPSSDPRFSPSTRSRRPPVTAAGDHADGSGAASDRAEDPEGSVSLLSLGERDGHDRQRRRRHQCGTETLESAGGDEYGRGLGEAGDERRHREDGQSGEEHSSTPQQVRHPSPE